MANEQNLKHFESGYDPRRNLKGRSKKWKTTLRDKGYAKSQVIDAINILITMGQVELEEVSLNEKSTALEKIVALSLLESIRKKTPYNIELFLTRVYGQPKQEIEQQVNITSFQVKFNEPDRNQLPKE